MFKWIASLFAEPAKTQEVPQERFVRVGNRVIDTSMNGGRFQRMQAEWEMMRQAESIAIDHSPNYVPTQEDEARTLEWNRNAEADR